MSLKRLVPRRIKRAAKNVLHHLGVDLVSYRDPLLDQRRLLSGWETLSIIDGGAYHGHLAQRYHRLFPDARIFAFEPQAESFAILEERTGTLPRVCAHRLALSSRNSTLKLYRGALGATTSASPPSAYVRRYYPKLTEPRGVEEVSAVALDQWAPGAGIPDIRIIKLDLQGHELDALRGAEETLRQSVLLVQVEVQFRPLYEEACLYHQVAEFLEQRGFSLYGLYDLDRGGDGQLLYGDAVYLHRERLKIA